MEHYNGGRQRNRQSETADVEDRRHPNHRSDAEQRRNSDYGGSHGLENDRRMPGSVESEGKVGRQRRQRRRRRDDPEAEPLIPDREGHDESSRRRSQQESERQPPPQPGLLRHLMKCGRLALQAQHPDFAKDSPHTAKVLKEALLVTRPLLKDVGKLLIEHERGKKGKKSFDPKMMLLRQGLKWIQRKAEEAEGDVKRMERKHSGKHGHKRKSGRKEGGRMKHRRRRGGESKERDRGPEGGNEQPVSDEDFVYQTPRARPQIEEAPSTEADNLEHWPDKQQSPSRERTAGSMLSSLHGGCQSLHDSQDHHQRVRERPQQTHSRQALRSHRRRESRHQAQNAEPPAEQKRPDIQKYPLPAPVLDHSSRRSPRFGLASGQQRCERKTDESRKDHDNGRRPSHTQQTQMSTGEQPGVGLAADYYNSFGPGSLPEQGNATQISRGTLRPEDSLSSRNVRRRNLSHLSSKHSRHS